MIRRVLAQIARHEIWLLVLVGPLLMFPIGSLPWLGLGIAALAPLARWGIHRRLSVRTPLDVPILILILMTVSGTAISIATELSGPRLWALVLGVIIYYAFVNWSGDARRWVGAVLLLALVTIGVLCLSMFGIDWRQVRLISIPWLYNSIPNLVSGLPGSGAGGDSDLFNPRWAGISMGFLAPVFLSILYFGRDHWLRILSGMTALAAIGLLLLTQSLQGIAGLAAGIFIILVWRWRWTLILLPVGIVGLAALILWLDPLQLAGYLFSNNNPLGIAVSLRVDIWSRALAMLHDMPYTGIGLNTFPLLQATFYPGFQIGLEPHAHNLYLQTALDLGVPGLLALLWLVSAWFGDVWRKARAATVLDHRLILVGLAAGMVSYLVHGWMDGLMLGAKPGVAIWMMLALGVSAPYPLDPLIIRRQQRSALGLPTMIIGGILLSLVLFPAGLPRNLGALQAHRALYQAAQGTPPAQAQLARAAGWLEQALERDPNDVFSWELRGQIESIFGQQEQASDAFSRRVQLDLMHPLESYFPPGVVLRWAGNQDYAPRTQSDDLLRVYTNWMIRYPQQAAHYVRLSLLQLDRGNPAGAGQILQQGLQAGAQPADLLTYLLAQLSAVQP